MIKHFNKNQIKFLFVSAGIIWALGLFALCIQSNLKARHLSMVSTVDTTDWKSYQNDEYRFEFKYPESLEFVNYGSIEDRLLGISLNLKGHETPFMNFEVLNKTSASIIVDAERRLTDSKIFNKVVHKSYSLDGINGKIIGNSNQIGFEEKVYREIIISLSNEKSLLITSVDFEQSFIDQILSTFKFTQ